MGPVQVSHTISSGVAYDGIFPRLPKVAVCSANVIMRIVETPQREGIHANSALSYASLHGVQKHGQHQPDRPFRPPLPGHYQGVA